MSARDAESGSSTYKGGSGSAGGLGNGGIGGGMGGGGNWGGGGGGGAGRNGGIHSGTGLTTFGTWHGNTAYGQPGGMAFGYAMRDPASLAKAGMAPTMGSYSNFKTLMGAPMFGGALSGQSFNGMNAFDAYGKAYDAWQASLNPPVQQGPLNRPTQPRPSPVADVPPPPVPPNIPRTYVPSRIHQIFDPNPWMPEVQGYTQGSMAPWPGQSAIPNNPPTYNDMGLGRPRPGVGGGGGGGW